MQTTVAPRPALTCFAFSCSCVSLLACGVCQVDGAVNIAAIACGAFHNLALVADGSVLSWGTNDYGQVNFAQTVAISSTQCQFTPALTTAEAVARDHVLRPGLPFARLLWSGCKA